MKGSQDEGVDGGALQGLQEDLVEILGGNDAFNIPPEENYSLRSMVFQSVHPPNSQ